MGSGKQDLTFKHQLDNTNVQIKKKNLTNNVK